MNCFRIAIAGFFISLLALPCCGQIKIKDEIIKKIQEALPVKAPAEPKAKRKVLLFSKTNGFRHGSIPVGVTALKMLGEKTGAFEAVHSEDDSVFESESLAKFDLVIMVNTTGQLFRPKKLPKQGEARDAALAREKQLKKNLVDFVKSGKGLAGMHSATDTYKDWKEYNEMMGGAFAGHPWHTDVPVRLLDSDHPLNKVFGGKGFTIKDEIYQFRDDTADPKNRRMLLALDPNWGSISKGKRKDGFYPISWICHYENGRTFYCSLGHRNEIFYNPNILEHYLAGIQYALGDLEAEDEPIDVGQ